MRITVIFILLSSVEISFHGTDANKGGKQWILHVFNAHCGKDICDFAVECPCNNPTIHSYELQQLHSCQRCWMISLGFMHRLYWLIQA